MAVLLKKASGFRIIIPAAIIALVVLMAGCSNSGGPEPGRSVVGTLAGNGKQGYANGTSAEAQFNTPRGVAVDGKGNVYVADTNNHRIRKITPAGMVTTLAGNSEQGYADGTGTEAQFSLPAGVAVDGKGNVYVADIRNHRIRKITPAGIVTTLAGNGEQGYADGTGTEAQFYAPNGVAVDRKGNVYVADTGNNRIRTITPTGVVNTLAGSGEEGYADGTGTEAQFSLPAGVMVDGKGNVYVADIRNHRIRKITPAGVVTTLAGSGEEGYADGTGTEAQFYAPNGVAVDGKGNVYVADPGNHRIRKISPAGMVTTLAGNGEQEYADGTGTEAQFYAPQRVAVDRKGSVYVADTNNHRIRTITREKGGPSRNGGPGGKGSLIGTWEGTVDGDAVTMTFTKDKVSINGETGFYKIKDNALVVWEDDEEDSDTSTYNINGNTLTLTTAGVSIELTRVVNKSGSGAQTRSGTLTINNCPKGVSLMVCANATPATQMAFISSIMNFVAVSTDGSSPFSLIGMDGSAWKATGTYMVYVTSGFNNYFKVVSFRNGSATVDYNEMTSQESLPLD
jgi:sugar lactone lactonase YvrE